MRSAPTFLPLLGQPYLGANKLQELNMIKTEHKIIKLLAKSFIENQFIK